QRCAFLAGLDVQGVSFFRTIDCDDRDSLAPLEQKGFERLHGCLSFHSNNLRSITTKAQRHKGTETIQQLCLVCLVSLCLRGWKLIVTQKYPDPWTRIVRRQPMKRRVLTSF